MTSNSENPVEEAVSAALDPLWILNDEQRSLQAELIKLCRSKILPNAIRSDEHHEFPRENLKALASLGLLGLLVPKHLGGRGGNMVTASMVVETIARYGCPSTAMVYSMHNVGLFPMLIRYHNNKHIQDILRRVDRDVLVASSAFSDPSTGGHFWYPLTSKCKYINDEQFRLCKFGSWCTSAGFADFYTALASSPNYDGQASRLTMYLIMKEHVRTYANGWKAMGMRGNQSGPMVVEAILTKDNIIGTMGDALPCLRETVPASITLFSACFNGIGLQAMDIAKKHVTLKTHADVGLKIADYATIQNYFGLSMCSIWTNRTSVYAIARQMDAVTNNCDFELFRDPNFLPWKQYGMAGYIIKAKSAEVSAEVAETMLRACGGTGYKQDFGLERIVRDSKAGWLMAPSNEYTRELVGQVFLFGPEYVDLWDEKAHMPSLEREMRKLTLDEKKALSQQLLRDIDESSKVSVQSIYKDEDFDNPFNKQAPKHIANNTVALHPQEYRTLTLKGKEVIVSDSKDTAILRFEYSDPNARATGCLVGQYIQMKITDQTLEQHIRFYSPISLPDDKYLEIAVKYEAQGAMSRVLRNIQPREKVDFRGPSGGFELNPDSMSELVLFATGLAVTPCIQIIRSIAKSSSKTNVTMFYCNTKESDILLGNELKSIVEKCANIRIIHVIKQPNETWAGETGDLDLPKIKKYIPDYGHKSKIIMCASSEACLTWVRHLRALGWPSDSIFIYGPFGTEYIRRVYGQNAKLSSHRS